jgi:hypothetical protein
MITYMRESVVEVRGLFLFVTLWTRRPRENCVGTLER